jgi:hypothetical protein
LSAAYDCRGATDGIISTYLMEVIYAIRDRVLFRNSHIVFCPEAAPADIAVRMKSYLHNVPNLTVAMEGNKAGTSPGFHPSHDNLLEMYTQARLCIMSNVMARYKECIFLTNLPQIGSASGDGRSGAEIICTQLLETQMKKVVFDPKEIANKHGQQNDLLISFIMAPYCINRIRDSRRAVYEHVDLRSDFENNLILARDVTHNVVMNEFPSSKEVIAQFRAESDLRISKMAENVTRERFREKRTAPKSYPWEQEDMDEMKQEFLLNEETIARHKRSNPNDGMENRRLKRMHLDEVVNLVDW